MPRKTAAEKQAETRSRLVDAATETFLERGYRSASLDEISERAGYSTGAVYSNFAGKEGLFLACLARLVDGQMKIWEDFLATAPELRPEPEAFGKMLASVLPSKPWNKALMEFRATALSDEAREALLESRQRSVDNMRRTVEVYCDTLGVTPTGSLDTITDVLIAAVDGLRFHSLVDPSHDIGAALVAAADLLLGVAARRG